MKLFFVNKSKSGLGVEWIFGNGGYAALDKIGMFRIMHRFKLVGKPENGTEKTFFARFQIGITNEPRISVFHLEAINPFEARWFLFILKLTSQKCFTVVFNFGWTLTLASRKYLKALAIGQVRQMEAQMKQKNVDSRIITPKKGGTIDPWEAQAHKLKVV